MCDLPFSAFLRSGNRIIGLRASCAHRISVQRSILVDCESEGSLVVGFNSTFVEVLCMYGQSRTSWHVSDFSSLAALGKKVSFMVRVIDLLGFSYHSALEF